MATKKYVSLERLQEYHALLEDHVATGDDSVKLYADGLAAGKADKVHEHVATDITNFDEQTKTILIDNQADWNVTDETDPAFIKNRTHWEETGEIVVIDNLTSSDYISGTIPQCEFISGQKYNVSWNGTSYETTCYSFEGQTVLVNDSSDLPFYIENSDSYGLYVSSDDENWTLSVSMTGSTIHHLHPKYIKDMYYEENTIYPEEVIFSDTLDFTTTKQIMGEPTGKIYKDVEYTVVFNGNSYDVVGEYSEEMGIVCLGNKELLLGNNPEVGLPFGVGEGGGMFGIFVMHNGTHEITITIKAQTTTIVHKIAEKYLPDPKPEVYNAGQQTAAQGAEIFNNYVNNTATGQFSHAEGWNTHAPGNEAHAEGLDTHAEGAVSHAEGIETYATGDYSHAEGYGAKASGEVAHAEGHMVEARGENSHAEGNYTVADSKDQHVQGRFNVIDSNNRYADIVGNGDSDSVRSNAHTLDWDGNAWFAGEVYVGGTSQDDGEKLITETEVNNKVSTLNTTISGLQRSVNELQAITSAEISALFA